MSDENTTASAPSPITPGEADGVDMAGAIAAMDAAKGGEAKEDLPPAQLEKPKAPKAEVEAVAEVPEKEGLKARLRSELAAKQRKVEERDRALSQREAEMSARQQSFQVESQRVAEQRANYDRLENLRKTNHRAWLAETGVNLKDIVKAQLAEMDPNVRQEQLREQVADLPKLIQAEAEKIVAAKLKERDAAHEGQIQRANVEASHAKFVSLCKSEETPTAAKFAERDEGFLIHTAYYIQNRFQQQFKRDPDLEELRTNVERYLALQDGGTPAKTNGVNGKKTPPRAAAKETSEKPLAEMSDDERMAAAVRQLKKDQEADAAENL